MVRTLIEGLPRVSPEFRVVHVNPQLSRDAADIGQWRWGKLPRLLVACGRAWATRLREGPMRLYYVPAPARRAPFFRDLLVMLLCRFAFRGLVLHWHAVGLGGWLSTHASRLERWLGRRLLGQADLAIVLSPDLVADAQALSPRRVAVVPNGIVDPLMENPTGAASLSAPGKSTLVRPSAVVKPFDVLFLGLCSREKGVFDALAAVALVHNGAPGTIRLVVAGNFADAAEHAEFMECAARLPAGTVQHVGFADAHTKRELFATADVLCLPTRYAHEGQPLVLLEALAHDVPIVTTRWRGIPAALPDEHVWMIEAGRPEQIAAALLSAQTSPRPNGRLREHFLANFTQERHLGALAAALGAMGKLP